MNNTPLWNELAVDGKLNELKKWSHNIRNGKEQTHGGISKWDEERMPMQ